MVAEVRNRRSSRCVARVTAKLGNANPILVSLRPSRYGPVPPDPVVRAEQEERTAGERVTRAGHDHRNRSGDHGAVELGPFAEECGDAVEVPAVDHGQVESGRQATIPSADDQRSALLRGRGDRLPEARDDLEGECVHLPVVDGRHHDPVDVCRQDTHGASFVRAILSGWAPRAPCRWPGARPDRTALDPPAPRGRWPRCTGWHGRRGPGRPVRPCPAPCPAPGGGRIPPW